MKKLLCGYGLLLLVVDISAAGMIYKACKYGNANTGVTNRVVGEEYQNSLAYRFALDYTVRLQDGISLENMNTDQFDEEGF